MAPDEIQAAIDRAEHKRAELAKAQPDAKQAAKVLKESPLPERLLRHLEICDS